MKEFLCRFLQKVAQPFVNGRDGHRPHKAGSLAFRGL